MYLKRSRVFTVKLYSLSYIVCLLVCELLSLAAPVAVDDLLHAGLESCDETDEPGPCQEESLVAAPRPVAQAGVSLPEGEELQQCGEQDP